MPIYPNCFHSHQSISKQNTITTTTTAAAEYTDRITSSQSCGGAKQEKKNRPIFRNSIPFCKIKRKQIGYTAIGLISNKNKNKSNFLFTTHRKNMYIWSTFIWSRARRKKEH